VDDQQLWQGFIEQGLENLHFVFCLDAQMGLGHLNDFPIFAHKCCISMMSQISNQDRVEIATEKLRGLRFDGNERTSGQLHYSVLHTICSVYSTAYKVGRAYYRHCHRQYALGISQHVDMINVFMSAMRSFSSQVEERVALLTNCETRLEELKTKAEQLIDDRTKNEAEIQEANQIVEELVIILGKKSTEMEHINDRLHNAQTQHSKRNEEYKRLEHLVAEARMSVVPGTIPEYEHACMHTQIHMSACCIHTYMHASAYEVTSQILEQLQTKFIFTSVCVCLCVCVCVCVCVWCVCNTHTPHTHTHTLLFVPSFAKSINFLRTSTLLANSLCKPLPLEKRFPALFGPENPFPRFSEAKLGTCRSHGKSTGPRGAKVVT
jgi:hypothetical protein